MRFIEFNEWRYCWTTVPNERLARMDYPTDRPYASWVEKPLPKRRDWRKPAIYSNSASGRPGTIKKITYFSKRASARKSAQRQKETHEHRNKNQAALRASGYVAPSYRCGNCDKNRKRKGDYLCQECRFGT